MRYKMADDIITSEIFLGQTKQEVLSQLGEPLSSNFEGRDHVIYALGKPPSFFEDNTQNLVLIFKNGRVTKVIRSEE